MSQETMTMREAVAQLVELKKHDIDMLGVLSEIAPGHAHWRTEADLPNDYDQPTNPFSRKGAEEYLLSRGIPSRVITFSEAPLSSQYGVTVEPTADKQLWNPEAAIQMFNEIDLFIKFDAPGVSDPPLGLVRDSIPIALNASQVEGSRYRPHLIGSLQRPDQKVKLITNGVGYLSRMDQYLKAFRIPVGIDAVVLTDKSQRLMACVQNNLIPRKG